MSIIDHDIWFAIKALRVEVADLNDQFLFSMIALGVLVVILQLQLLNIKRQIEEIKK